MAEVQHPIFSLTNYFLFYRVTLSQSKFLSHNGEDQGKNRDGCFSRIPQRLGGFLNKAKKGGHGYEAEDFFIVDNGGLLVHWTFYLDHTRRIGRYARGMETNREYGDEPAA